MTLLCALALAAGASAQDDDLGLAFEKESGSSGVSFYGGFDLASAYAWRGNLLVKGANFQPNIEFDAGPFALGLWNCTDFHGDMKEFDIYTSITAGQVTFTITDYFTQEDTNDPDAPRYGNYKKDETAHTFEFSVDWTSEFGLDASMNVLLYGADKKWWDPEKATDNAYGTYFELGYTTTVKEVDFRTFVGTVFNQSTWYGDGTGTHKGVNVVNLGVKASKEISISDKFKLPVYACFGYNPQADDVAAFAGFTLSF
jgi:hypothetical protein